MPAGENEVANRLAIAPFDVESLVCKSVDGLGGKILLGCGDDSGGGGQRRRRRPTTLDEKLIQPTSAFLLSLGPVTETTLNVHTRDTSFVQLYASLDWFGKIHSDVDTLLMRGAAND